MQDSWIEYRALLVTKLEEHAVEIKELDEKIDSKVGGVYEKLDSEVKSVNERLDSETKDLTKEIHVLDKKVASINSRILTFTGILAAAVSIAVEAIM